jgi:hypothetical protein
MGCSCGCRERPESINIKTKEKVNKISIRKKNKVSNNIFYDYNFSNNLFNAEENAIIYTNENFTKNQFITLNNNQKENIENSTYKEKSLAISYIKGYKLDTPNQDKFFIIVDGDFEVFCLIDGHGPFGHTLAQYIEEYFFSNISNWKCRDIENSNDNENINKLDYENLIKELFNDCQNHLTNDVSFHFYLNFVFFLIFSAY